MSGDHLLAVGGFDGSNILDIEVLGIQKDDTNCNPTNLPFKLRGHATVFLPNLGLVTCGGSNDKQRTSTCIVQSKSSDQTFFPSMRTRRSFFGMVVVSNKLYVIGGNPSDATMETIDINRPRKWTEEPIPFAVTSHCVVSLDDKIIVTGGCNELRGCTGDTGVSKK